MLNMCQMPAALVEPALESLARLPVLDAALRDLGTRPDRAPADYSGPWVDHLAWGVDSAVATVRLLLSGQVVGAAVVARNQLERWTNNLAYNVHAERTTGEGLPDFIARVWGITVEGSDPAEGREEPEALPDDAYEADLSDEGAAPDEEELDHAHITFSDGTETCPGAAMAFLSDILHGREATAAILWDARDLLAGAACPPRAGGSAVAVADVITLNLRRLQACVATAAVDGGQPRLAALVASAPDRSPAGRGTPSLSTRVPLLPGHGLAPHVVTDLRRQEQTYDAVTSGRRVKGRYLSDDKVIHLAVGAHRSRAAAHAQAALDAERTRLGVDFDPSSLWHRDYLYIVTGELAGVLSGWLDEREAAVSAATAATALRSAYWLWLEDDDRAMAVLRVLLEHVARLRAFRLKPERAKRYAQDLRTTPRDWLDCAGWKRLAALNSALGEMAHARVGARWAGARDLLTDLQPQPGEYPQATARGSALNVVVALFVQELLATTKELSTPLGEAVDRVFADLGADRAFLDQLVARYLDHAWSLKGRPLGARTFSGPAIDRLDAEPD